MAPDPLGLLFSLLLFALCECWNKRDCAALCTCPPCRKDQSEALRGLALLCVSHGMLQPAPAQCCSLLRALGLLQSCFRASLGPACPIPTYTGVPGLCWPCPGTPCAGDSRVGVGCAIGGSTSLEEGGEDLLLLAGGLFSAGPLVLSRFAVAQKWGFLGCKAGSCS